MKNKRNIIAFILLLLPLVVAVGMSTWIILNESLLTPSYNPDPVIKKYFSKENVTYNGSQQYPISSTSDLVDFDELNFEYKIFGELDKSYVKGKPTNAGHYVVRVTVIDLDNSAREIDFIIEPKPISIEVYDVHEFTFNNDDQYPSIRIIDGELITGDTCEVKKTFESKNAGKYTLSNNDIILTNSNYTLGNNISCDYEIKPISISDTIITFNSIENCNFDGTPQTPNIKAKANFKVGSCMLQLGYDYTVVYENNIKEGTEAKAIVTGNGNYKGTKTLTFEIVAGLIDLSKATISKIPEQTYSGKAQTPTVEVSIGGEILTAGKDFEFSYNDNIDAGKATLTINSITGVSKNTQSKTFIILPLSLTLDNAIFEIDYDSSNREWENFKNNILIALIRNNLKDLRNKSSIDSTIIANISLELGMHNGIFAYGSELYINNLKELDNIDVNSFYNTGVDIDTYPYIVGSTYLLSVSFESKNIILAEENGKALVKYKTVLVNNTHYTIEDAINDTTGNITLEGNKDSTNSFVYTSFCGLDPSIFTNFNVKNLVDKNYTLNSRTLLVPYEKSETIYKSDNNINKQGKVYSSLLIPKNTILNASSNSCIAVGAKIGFNQSLTTTLVNDHGVLLNYGTININSNCSLLSYGFLKGGVDILDNEISRKGQINVNSGGSATTCFSIYDFSGGVTAYRKYKKVLLTNSWTLHNISCDILIYKGGKYSAYFYAYPSTTAEATPLLIGESNSTSNCLYKPAQNSKSSDYIRFYATAAKNCEIDSSAFIDLFSVIGNNQNLNSSSSARLGQRDCVEVNGNYTDEILTLSFKVNVSGINQTISLSTSTDKPLTVGFMDIVLNENSYLTLSKASYLFLPGSSLKIDSNATLIIEKDVSISLVGVNDLEGTSSGSAYFLKYSIYDKDDAFCLNNGTLTIKGSIGGTISTTTYNSIINFESGSKTKTKYKIYYNAIGGFSGMFAADNQIFLTPDKTTYINVNGNLITPSSPKSYISSTIDGKNFYWIEKDT